MGTLYRSEPMTYVRLLMTEESAHDTIADVGSFGNLHLVDLSHPDVQTEAYLYYKKRVQACDAWEKRLLAFVDPVILEEFGLETIAPLETAPTREFGGDLLVELARYLEPHENELAKNMQFRSLRSQQMNDLKERKIVFEMCLRLAKFGDESKADVERSSAYRSFDPLERKSEGKESYDPFLEGGAPNDQAGISNRIVGVIPTDRQGFFERMIFRMSRGNAITEFIPIEQKITDPATGEVMTKSFFSVVFVGSQLKSRIFRTCTTFNATRYTVPNTHTEIKQAISALDDGIGESRAVLQRTTDEITTLLRTIIHDPSLRRSPLADWLYLVGKEKAISDALRKCDLSNPRAKTIRAEGWVPTEDIERLRSSLSRAGSGREQAVMQIVVTQKPRPTYFKTNKVTETFQGIVDTYGIARYQEVNPGMFAIVTFPFLFGVMYGDIGHGLLLTLMSGYILYKEKYYEEELRAKRIKDEIFKMVFSGRYLIFMMGLFAIYCGTIYNDCMSIPTNVFGTKWNETTSGEAYTWSGEVYPYGVDPSWYHKSNELSFMNSLKMKMSVTIGVIHMTFGVFLSLSNHLYWGDNVGIFCEFLPRLLFLLCTFGYMIFIIIAKMVIDWSGDRPNQTPPNLVVTMIDLFLSPGSVSSSNQLYEGQATVQAVLLLIAFISMPWMLFGSPCIVRSRVMAARRRAGRPPVTLASQASPQHAEVHESKGLLHESGDIEGGHHTGTHAAATSHSDDEHEGGGHAHGMPANIWEYSFGDSMITASIHTIEYVLGTVSNTASYLRLWALSLAHSELAQVFWSKMIVQYGIDQENPIMVFVAFAVWAGATFGVLLCMDVLECFLHALRLHWVEFQNKFFYADGYAYEPFRYTLELPDNSK